MILFLRALGVVAFAGLAPWCFAQGPDSLASSQIPAAIAVPAEAQPSPNFNVDAATNGYLAEIPAAARARSDAYFEGGYWLVLWDFAATVIASLLLLNLGWSAKMRDLAQRLTRFKPVHTAVYFVQFMILTSVLTFPLAVYEGYIREHKYGLANQTFGPWMGDQLKALLVNTILGAVIAVLLFGIVRRLQKTWWIWGAIVTSVFIALSAMIAPIVIFPLFNKVTKLADPKVTAPILSLARANNIPAREVYEIDASRQTTRMSANVSGFGKTMRVTLNDNLLRRGSAEEIQAVMGHEMGHYVLHHVYWGIFVFSVVVCVAFALLRWALDWSIARWGENWQISGITDLAVVPLVALLASIFFFLITPVLNTLGRTQEHEADMYGLNASRQPDGFAQAAIHLAEYRKMSPGPVEEWIFYDHPSGRTRIHDAMTWKAENLSLVQQQQTAAGPPGK
jgi:STE24 endopeptidase